MFLYAHTQKKYRSTVRSFKTLWEISDLVCQIGVNIQVSTVHNSKIHPSSALTLDENLTEKTRKNKHRYAKTGNRMVRAQEVVGTRKNKVHSVVGADQYCKYEHCYILHAYRLWDALKRRLSGAKIH